MLFHSLNTGSVLSCSYPSVLTLAVPSKKCRPPPGGQPEPTRAKNAQDVAAREYEYIAGCSSNPCDDAIGTRAGVGGRFATRTAVAKQLPARALLQNFRRASAFVAPVIPFDEVAVLDRRITEAGELAGVFRPL